MDFAHLLDGIGEAMISGSLYVSFNGELSDDLAGLYGVVNSNNHMFMSLVGT